MIAINLACIAEARLTGPETEGSVEASLSLLFRSLPVVDCRRSVMR